VVTRETLPIVPALLGLPCVIKEPESSFSRGVHRVASEAELVELVLVCFGP
jgi:glutathione synthase/RimK-type ligase-like ATP-grasp enzyme